MLVRFSPEMTSYAQLLQMFDDLLDKQRAAQPGAPAASQPAVFPRSEHQQAVADGWFGSSTLMVQKLSGFKRADKKHQK